MELRKDEHCIWCGGRLRLDTVSPDPIFIEITARGGLPVGKTWARLCQACDDAISHSKWLSAELATPERAAVLIRLALETGLRETLHMLMVHRSYPTVAREPGQEG